MTKLALVEYPNQILTTYIDNDEFPTQEEAKQSYEIMKSNNGVGIAAPQVGVAKRFFWFNDELAINPEILAVSDVLVNSVEGCLSLPGLQFTVVRHYAIKVKYKTLLGKSNDVVVTLVGNDSIIFQHEFDHLNGKLINDQS